MSKTSRTAIPCLFMRGGTSKAWLRHAVARGSPYRGAARRGQDVPDPGAGTDMSGRIAGLSSMATRHILADLARDYEARNGIRVDIRSMGGVEAAKLVRAGEPTDVVMLASKVMKSLEAEGHVAKGSIMDFARSEIAIAVPSGSPRSGVESEQAVRQAMLDARRICYSTGPSGDHLKALCEKWGVSRLCVGARPGGAAGRPSGQLGCARRRRSRFSANERTHSPTRDRDHWGSTAGDPGRNRVLGRRIQQVCGA